MKLLPPLFGDEWTKEDTVCRMKALRDVLNTDLGDRDAVLGLGLRLYGKYRHSSDGWRIPPVEDDVPVLQSDFRLLKAGVEGSPTAATEAEIRRLNDLCVLGQFYKHLGDLDFEDGGPPLILEFIERVWPEGMDEDAPHATATKIAADVLETILAIGVSDDEFRIFRCERARCGRWVVAWHDGQLYCSDRCRKANDHERERFGGGSHPDR